jgi:alanine racemase
MNYRISELVKIINAKLLKKGDDSLISRIEYDSRNLIRYSKSLFVALKTTTDNGHKYLNEVVESGQRNLLISDDSWIEGDLEKKLEKCNVLLVNNTLYALQKLAAYHRKTYNYEVIGITGSNGKTIVKEWLFQLLNDDYRICRSPKSFNSQLGVPLSILNLREFNDLGIFEAGISTVDEMELLEEIIQPDFGIFTNIGSAHQEGFSSIKEKVDEKLKLFKNCKTLIYCKDYKEIEGAVQEKVENGFFNNTQFIGWSKSEGEVIVQKVSESQGFSILKIKYFENEFECQIPFLDNSSIENASHCIVYLMSKEFEPEKIYSKLKNLTSVEMRLELKEGINSCTLINDTYNSDLESLVSAIDHLNRQNQNPTKTIILSDIFQTGKTDKELYLKVAEIVDNYKINRFIGIGESISKFQKLFAKGSLFFNDTKSFIENLSVLNFENEAILIKGARKFKFEEIVKKLQKKVHATRLEINLKNLISNYKTYRALLKPETKVMAMVKAFSYGGGSFEIANVLQHHQADYLAVAYADEGVGLREKGVHIPIMVMNTNEESFESLLQYNLEPEIYNLDQLKRFAGFLKHKEVKDFPVHIEIDTGMHRLGFKEDDILELINVLNSCQKISIKSVFSHLVGADEKVHDKFTEYQIEDFNSFVEHLEKGLNYKIEKHILNSSGIVRFPEAQFDMVRLGIGLYGFDPTGILDKKLLKVSSFKTIVSQIHQIKKGETVGYGRVGVAIEDKKVAVINVGYSDGFPRAFSNGVGEVLINGVIAPVFGNVCMDMTMIDVTGIEVKQGDEVTIFGDGLSIEELASKLETIPYEILTNISYRVKRVYYNE